jgi:hypothetical protein
MNEEGRALLLRELQLLSDRDDHFHLGTYEGSEVRLSAKAYRPTDTIIHTGKIYFRTDEWDRTHFPHVMEDEV